MQILPYLSSYTNLNSAHFSAVQSRSPQRGPSMGSDLTAERNKTECMKYYEETRRLIVKPTKSFVKLFIRVAQRCYTRDWRSTYILFEGPKNLFTIIKEICRKAPQHHNHLNVHLQINLSSMIR